MVPPIIYFPVATSETGKVQLALKSAFCNSIIFWICLDVWEEFGKPTVWFGVRNSNFRLFGLRCVKNLCSSWREKGDFTGEFTYVFPNTCIHLRQMTYIAYIVLRMQNNVFSNSDESLDVTRN